MKSYTDLEQSKKLAEILPIESADMGYLSEESLVPKVIYNGMVFFNSEEEKLTHIIHCWSIAALLSVLPIITKGKDTANPFVAKTPNNEYYVVYVTLTEEVDSSAICDNPVDACVETIIKLHELKML